MSYAARIAAVMLLLAGLTLAAVYFAPQVGDVTVSSQSPTGGEAPLDGPISVTFSRPVERGSAERAFVLYPPTKGHLTWQGQQTLVFVPGERLQPQTTYRVTIRPGLRDARGRANLQMSSWIFRTR